MMGRRRVLAAIVLATFGVGIVLAAVPFLFSLKPNAKAYAAVPRFPIPAIGPNSYTYLPNPREQGRHFPMVILVVSDENGQKRYWSIPTVDGTTAIPDKYPYRGVWKCKDLSPDFEERSIRCKDDDWAVREWADPRWDFRGRDISNYDWLPDLEAVVGREINGDYVLLRPGA